MMKLFIKIQNGQPFEHPIFEQNFLEAFPNIDIENLPIDFAEFIRIEPPVLNKFEVYEGVTYEKDENLYVWKDVHHVREMTSEEKENYITNLKNQQMPENWVFDEENCMWINPESSNKS